MPGNYALFTFGEFKCEIERTGDTVEYTLTYKDQSVHESDTWNSDCKFNAEFLQEVLDSWATTEIMNFSA